MFLGFGYSYVRYVLFLIFQKEENNRLKKSQLAKILYFFFGFA